MNEDINKLENELNFLKESFGAEVISQEEYDREKERIEKKISELKSEDKQDIKIKETVLDQDEEQQKKLAEVAKEQALEKEKAEEARDDAPSETEEIEESKEVEKGSNLIRISIIIILIVAGFLYYTWYYNQENTSLPEEIISGGTNGLISCYTDDDCIKDGFIGTCNDKGTPGSSCEYVKLSEVKMLIINDPDCKSCKTENMIGIIKQLFPGTEVENIVYDSDQGQELIENLSLETLPSYLLIEEVSSEANFERFKQALVKKGNYYVIKPSASGAPLLFTRPETNGTLELFTTPEHLNAKDNVEEVLDLFKDQIEFTTKIASEEDSALQELAITSRPTFLVNNKLKFSGIQSPNFIKEKFCEMNKLEGCSKELSKKII